MAKRPVGRPRKIEGEQTVVGGNRMMAYVPSPGGSKVEFYNTDEIIQRKGLREYALMRHDDQVKLCLSFKKLLVTGRAYSIVPADDSAKAKEIAHCVEWALERINLKQIFREALTAIEFGFSLGEIVWELADYEGERKVVIKDIKHRDPVDLKIFTDLHGNVKGFQQNTIGGKKIEIEPVKAWHFVHNQEFQNQYGQSDLRSVYRSWWAKKFLINFWSVFLERFGQPMTMMKYPHGASPELKSVLRGILQGLSTKTEILVPDGVEVQLVEATRGGTATYKEAIDYHDHAISRGLLMVSLLGAGGDNVNRGSDSQSRLHLRVLFKMAQELGDYLAFTFMRQVVHQMVDMNYVHENLYPEFLWQDYGEFEGIEVADTIRLLHAAGILDMDQADVNYSRSILGLPLRGEDDKPDEVVRPQPLPPPADANSPPPKASQGNQQAAKGPKRST